MPEAQFSRTPKPKPLTNAERTPMLGRNGLVWLDPARGAAEEARREGIRRALYTALRFWSACTTRRCRRWRSCAGDATRCHAIFWPVVPEKAKVWWRAAYDARREGYAVDAVGQIADAHCERWKESGRKRALAKANSAPPERAGEGH